MEKGSGSPHPSSSSRAGLPRGDGGKGHLTAGSGAGGREGASEEEGDGGPREGGKEGLSASAARRPPSPATAVGSRWGAGAGRDGDGADARGALLRCGVPLLLAGVWGEGGAEREDGREGRPFPGRPALLRRRAEGPVPPAAGWGAWAAGASRRALPFRRWLKGGSSGGPVPPCLGVLFLSRLWGVLRFLPRVWKTRDAQEACLGQRAARPGVFGSYCGTFCF